MSQQNQSSQPTKSNDNTPGATTTQPAGPVADKINALLASAKTPIPDSALVEKVKQAPQALKELGEKTATQVNKLTTVQKVVGGALLAGGIGWLLVWRKKQAKPTKRSKKAQTQSGFRPSEKVYRRPQ